jgi:ATP-binding cassette subfamily F protein uup
MAPPLLNLDNIRLTFGGTPLLDGASLSVSPGDRIALVGRNGSGKSTLLKIAAGWSSRRTARCSATLGDDPLPAADAGHGRFRHRARLCRGGLGPADDPHRVTYLLEHLGLDRRGIPTTCPAARRAAPRWRGCWRPNPTSCCSTSRPTISTSPPSNGSKTS